MIGVRFDTKAFSKDLKNAMDYSIGFLEGAKIGKTLFLKGLGDNLSEVLKQYIDSNARANPEMLHHVYEWHKTGGPEARLFDIVYTVSNLGLSFKSTFSQSKSIQNGATEPFYNKAYIMENGIPVTIKPKKSNVLVFESNGETVVTPNPVTVSDPGGSSVEGGFEKIFDSFFTKYFTQAFFVSSGVKLKLENPSIFKKNFAGAKTGGRAKGIQTGQRWIINAGVVN